MPFASQRLSSSVESLTSLKTHITRTIPPGEAVNMATDQATRRPQNERARSKNDQEVRFMKSKLDCRAFVVIAGAGTSRVRGGIRCHCHESHAGESAK